MSNFKNFITGSILSLGLTSTPVVNAQYPLATPNPHPEASAEKFQKLFENISSSCNNIITPSPLIIEPVQHIENKINEIMCLKEKMKIFPFHFFTIQTRVEELKNFYKNNENEFSGEEKEIIENFTREIDFFIKIYEYFQKNENITKITHPNANKNIIFLGQTHYTKNGAESYDEVLFSQKAIEIYLNYFAPQDAIIAIEWNNMYESTEEDVIIRFMDFFTEHKKLKHNNEEGFRFIDKKDEENIALLLSNNIESIDFLGKKYHKDHPDFEKLVTINYFLNQSWEKEEIVTLLGGYVFPYFDDKKIIVGIEGQSDTLWEELENIEKNLFPDFEKFLHIAGKKKIDEYKKSNPKASKKDIEDFTKNIDEILKSLVSIYRINSPEEAEKIFKFFSTENPENDEKLKKEMLHFIRLIHNEREQTILKNIANIPERNIVVIYGDGHRENMEELFQKHNETSQNPHNFTLISTSPLGNKDLQKIYIEESEQEWVQKYVDHINKYSDIREIFFKNFSQK